MRGVRRAAAIRIAVLPFENEGTAADDYFADGMTDEVRSRLSSVPGLQVTARTSTRQYKKTTKDPHDIGRELSVDYLLTGTVRWSKGNGPDRVRVTPELVQVSNNQSKWSVAFDTVMSDVFAVQAAIASHVAQNLTGALAPPTQQRLASRPTQNLEAYDEFLKGEQITANVGTGDSRVLNAGIPHYERAVAARLELPRGLVAVGSRARVHQQRGADRRDRRTKPRGRRAGDDARPESR